jgi:hypothetical protein
MKVLRIGAHNHAYRFRYGKGTDLPGAGNVYRSGVGNPRLRRGDEHRGQAPSLLDGVHGSRVRIPSSRRCNVLWLNALQDSRVLLGLILVLGCAVCAQRVRIAAELGSSARGGYGADVAHKSGDVATCRLQLRPEAQRDRLLPTPASNRRKVTRQCSPWLSTPTAGATPVLALLLL